ncbi:hypothetical protein [Palleronia caenipelagi]|nr:hypothetical protein [Palleronia caenipelagi]
MLFMVNLGVAVFGTTIASAEITRPTTMAELTSPEATEAMIAETGAFKVDMGGAGSLVFLRQPDGTYKIAGALPRGSRVPGCDEVSFQRGEQTEYFGVCKIEGWKPPTNFEQQIVTAYEFSDFARLLEETRAPLPEIGGGPGQIDEIPAYVAAITYNGAPEINRKLWETAAAVIWSCREPEGRSTSGLVAPTLKIEASRVDCRDAKSGHSSGTLAAAEDMLAITADERAAAEARAQMTAEERAAAEARAAFIRKLIDRLS